MDRTEQNEKLRTYIVDLADLWDGPHSAKYGKVLQDILNKLEIDDVPVFYSVDMKKMLDEME